MPTKSKVKVTLTTPKLPRNSFTLFAKEALLTVNKANEEFAKAALKEVREVVKKQKYNWQPLEPGYLKRKIDKGLDYRTLMATREYINKGIGIRRKAGFIFVGPKEGTHKPSGLPYEYLARIHEYGTLNGNIPARPLWRPVLSVLLRRKKKYAKAYRKAIKKAWDSRLKKATQKKVRVK